MDTWITICAGCKKSDWNDRGVELPDGEIFATAIESMTEQTGIKTRRVSCTMGCERACNVIVQGIDSLGNTKIGYSLGRFDGTESDAEALVEYAKLHAASPNGQVPFRTWPAGVKGHFVSRHLPLPTDAS